MFGLVRKKRLQKVQDELRYFQLENHQLESDLQAVKEKQQALDWYVDWSMRGIYIDQKTISIPFWEPMQIGWLAQAIEGAFLDPRCPYQGPSPIIARYGNKEIGYIVRSNSDWAIIVGNKRMVFSDGKMGWETV
jgi:hypothetical protein